MAELNFGFSYFIFLYGHNVSVEDDEISVFAYFNAAFTTFKEAAFGYPNRDGTQGLLACEGVLHLETFGGRAVQMLAGDGGIESVNRADVLDGEVGAVDDPAVLLQQLLVGVGVLDALAKTLVGPVHIGSAMRGLDGRDDGKLAKTLEIRVAYRLRVLNAPAEVVIAFEVFGKDVQDMMNSAVADGVATHLITSVVGLLANVAVEVVAFQN